MAAKVSENTHLSERTVSYDLWHTANLTGGKSQGNIYYNDYTFLFPIIHHEGKCVRKGCVPFWTGLPGVFWGMGEGIPIVVRKIKGLRLSCP